VQVLIKEGSKSSIGRVSDHPCDGEVEDAIILRTTCEPSGDLAPCILILGPSCQPDLSVASFDEPSGMRMAAEVKFFIQAGTV
jgi:hypothetical protein